MQQKLIARSVWILEFTSKLDELMRTIANKSKLSKAHMDPYIYACIIELAKWFLIKVMEEDVEKTKAVEVVELAKQMAADMSNLVNSQIKASSEAENISPSDSSESSSAVVLGVEAEMDASERISQDKKIDLPSFPSKEADTEDEEDEEEDE